MNPLRVTIWLDRGGLAWRSATALILLCSVLGPSLRAEAQIASKLWRIGVLTHEPTASWVAFRTELDRRGWVEGRNVVYEFRYMEGRGDEAPRLAADLVGRQVDVIVAVSGLAVRAAMEATKTTPIVFVGITDPVRLGFVASLAKPGGNVTGIAYMGIELNPKRLQLLQELAPGVKRVAALVNPAHVFHASIVAETTSAAQRLGITLQVVEARRPEDLGTAFDAAVRAGAGALVVLQHPMFLAQRQHIVDLAARHRLPAVYDFELFIPMGGLMYYGARIVDQLAATAAHVDKVLRGTSPADLPVEQPTKFALIVNLKTARALGLTMPPSLLLRADQIVE